ncbi:MAG: hypothetical protein QOE69_768 [Thermoleophilaceae bacterium]|jgi:lysophospholipase L1-like esterase|nr:hypothetical protein [Thermoleophilaceae bacterium]MEA2406649.1 hypothetical protein [Thermoleophilaceae bacterium]
MYVALGDSFTAGHEPGQPRWADELARELGGGYVNLAEVGATSEHVESEQLGRALELRPDVVTLVCGANDVLFSTRPDADAYAARLSRMFARLRREVPTIEIVTATYPDISRFIEVRPRTRARVEEGMRLFNAAARRVAEHHDVVLMDSFDYPEANSRATYADDGFHPSAEGHRQAARAFLRALRQRLRLSAA